MIDVALRSVVSFLLGQFGRRLPDAIAEIWNGFDKSRAGKERQLQKDMAKMQQETELEKIRLTTQSQENLKTLDADINQSNNTKEVDIETQKAITEHKKIEHQIKVLDTELEKKRLDLIHKSDALFANPNNDKYISIANFLRSSMRPLIAMYLTIIFGIISAILIYRNNNMDVYYIFTDLVSMIIGFVFDAREASKKLQEKTGNLINKYNKKDDNKTDNKPTNSNNNQTTSTVIKNNISKKTTNFDIEKTFKFIKKYEGCSSLTRFKEKNNTPYYKSDNKQVLYPYQCTAGVWTIGFGDTISCKYQSDEALKDGTFSKTYDECLKTAKGLIQENFYTPILNALKPERASELTTNQWSAMLSLAWQQGIDGFLKSKTFKAINENDIENIKKHWVNGWKGFEKRRKEELSLYLEI